MHLKVRLPVANVARVLNLVFAGALETGFWVVL